MEKELGDDHALWGELKNGVHISEYAFERACRVLEGLLEGDRWKLGGRFATINEFLVSISLDKLRATAEERKRIALRIKELQPDVSKRTIAKALGVDERTVRRDAAPEAEKANKTNASKTSTAADAAPPVSGAKAAAIVERRTAPPEPVQRRPDEQIVPERMANQINLYTHEGTAVPYRAGANPVFNRTNDHISWAKWSWNPVTGCLHGCPYCYAREISLKDSMKEFYPVGFTPLFHSERLSAPRNTTVPKEAANDSRERRVFVCSMADLYGKWVPDEWIKQVHQACIKNPQWEYLMLTKFPRRYVGLELPATAWLGTSIDEQKRVRLAEEAFRQISGVRVRWLSIEPFREELAFSDLSMFDWIVIGAQSETQQPDGPVAAFAPPFKWVSRLVAQADEAGCKVYLKPNLLGIVNSQSPGMQLPQEEPDLPNLDPQLCLPVEAAE